jgi:hypothetical protein
MVQPQFNSAILPAYARLLHRDSSVHPTDNFYNPIPFKKKLRGQPGEHVPSRLKCASS